MSIINAQLSTTAAGSRVSGYEKIEFDFQFVDNVFDIRKPELANHYLTFKRCLAIVDHAAQQLYGSQLQQYFQFYGIPLTVFPIVIEESDKTLETLQTIVDAFCHLTYGERSLF